MKSASLLVLQPLSARQKETARLPQSGKSMVPVSPSKARRTSEVRRIKCFVFYEAYRGRGCEYNLRLELSAKKSFVLKSGDA